MKKVLLFLAGIAIVAISCTKEVEIQKPDDHQISKKVLTVTVNAPETKTVLNDERSGLEWTTGDNFRLMTDTDDASHDATTLNYVADGKFTPTVSVDATEVYAYYFAGDYTDTNHSTPTAYTTYINPVQTQSVAGVLNGQNLPMAAKGTINSDNTVTLNFHQMAAVLALNIYSTEKVSGEKIQSVIVTPTDVTNNIKFVGSRSSNLTEDNVIFDTGTSSSAYTNVKVELTNAYDYGTVKPNTANDKKMFAGQIYVVLAKQNYATLKFEVVTNKGTYTINGTSFDLTKTDFLPVNINLKSAAATFEASLLNKVFFNETFKDSGSSMSTATGTVKTDNEGWTLSNGYGAGDCIRLGTSSNLGSATTPSISFIDNDAAYLNKELTLTFKAVAWSNKSSNLKLSATNASLSRSSVTMNTDQSTWTNYTITVTPTNSPITIRFEGNKAKDSQFFLDDVKLAYTKGVDLDPDAEYLSFNKSSESFLATDNNIVSKVFSVSTIQNINTWSIVNSNTTDFTASADVANGTITVTPTGVNNTYSTKEATITVSADGISDIDLSVSQAAKVAVFTVSPSTTSKLESAADDTQYLTITSNIPWTVALDDEVNASIVNNEDKASSYSSPAEQSTVVELSFNANTGDERSFNFTVTPDETGSGKSAEVVTFTQKAAGAVEPEIEDVYNDDYSACHELNFTAAGGTYYNFWASTNGVIAETPTISITGTDASSFSYNITSSASSEWGVLFSITATANSGAARSAKLTVKYDTATWDINLTQDACSDLSVTINAGALTGSADPYTLTSNGFTLTFRKNTGSTAPAYNSNGGDIRVYAKGTIQIAGTNKTIKSVVFNVSTQGLKRLAPITASPGTVATQASGDDTVSWSGSTSSVTFTVGDKADYGSDGSSKAGQLCFSSVEITYVNN